MTAQHVTLGVLFRWLRARRQVQEQMQAARMAVVRVQLQAMRATYPR